MQTFAKLLGEKEAAELFTLTLNEEKAADKKLSLLAKSINIKAKAEKPPASVKIAVKKSAKLPVKIPSAGQREVQGIESNIEAKQSQPNESLMVHLDAEEGAFGAVAQTGGLI